MTVSSDPTNSEMSESAMIIKKFDRSMNREGKSDAPKHRRMEQEL
jgi:hypothetical protein